MNHKSAANADHPDPGTLPPEQSDMIAQEAACLEHILARGRKRFVLSAAATTGLGLAAVSVLLFAVIQQSAVFNVLYGVPFAALAGALWGVLAFRSHSKRLALLRSGELKAPPPDLRENNMLNVWVMWLMLGSIQLLRWAGNRTELKAIAVMLCISSIVIQLWVAVRVTRRRWKLGAAANSQKFLADNPQWWVQWIFALFVIAMSVGGMFAYLKTGK